MNYTEKLRSIGFKIEFEKGNSDKQGYDLYLRITKNDGFYELLYSLSHSVGYYFSYDWCNLIGEADKWDIDNNKLICDFLGTDELKEI